MIILLCSVDDMLSKFSGLDTCRWLNDKAGWLLAAGFNRNQHRCNSISLEQKEYTHGIQQKYCDNLLVNHQSFMVLLSMVGLNDILDSNWRTWHDFLQPHIEFWLLLFILVIHSYFSMIIDYYNDLFIRSVFHAKLTLSTVHASSLEILLIFTFPTFSSWSLHGILPVVVPSGWSGAGSELSLGMCAAVHHFGRLSLCSIPSSKRKASESFTVETWKARSFGKRLEMMEDQRFDSKTVETNLCSLLLLA